MKKNLLLLMSLSFISVLAFGQKFEKAQKSSKVAEFKSRLQVSTSTDPITLIKAKTLKATELEANELVAPKTILKSNLKSAIVKKATIDTTHIYPWDFNTQDWGTTPIARLLKYYDEQGNLTQYRAFSWHSDTESWVDSVQYFYKYNDASQITSTLQQSWQFDGIGEYKWINYDYAKTEYNDLGQELKYIYQYWDSGLNEWIGVWQHEFTYDSNGNNIGILESYWDGSQWTPGLNFINKYDDQNHLIDNPILIWDYNMNDWSNGFRYSYEFDANGNNVKMLLQVWNFEINDWDNAQLKAMVYNESNKIESYIFQNWDPFSFIWLDSQRGIYKYDSNGNNTAIIGQDYDPYTDTWSTSWQNLFDFNDQNKQISSASLYWDASFGNWYSGNKTKSAKIKSNNNIANNQTVVSEVSVYPNPTSEMVFIKNSTTFNSIQIFDITGNEMLAQNYFGLTSIELNIANFAAGVYILKIIDSEGYITNKRIIKR